MFLFKKINQKCRDLLFYGFVNKQRFKMFLLKTEKNYGLQSVKESYAEECVCV